MVLNSSRTRINTNDFFFFIFSGILAVTRSLGDCAMKDYVTGDPYTSDVKLESTDTQLILACDGVCSCFQLATRFFSNQSSPFSHNTALGRL